MRTILIMLLLFCYQHVASAEELNTMIGYVIDVEDTRALVVERRESSEGVVFGQPVWFNLGQKAHIGDLLKVTYTNLLKSYPAQGAAETVQVLTPTYVNGSRNSEGDIIQKALIKDEVKQLNKPVIVSMVFSQGQWTTVWKPLLDEKEVTVVIAD
ncbi:DUF3221 domain-containing protein [Mangrovibacillus cuniculi]|uniref:DUF3221 domain-containing protein n=1 Tax=Mangrovibacillus cuniculi TaxID=2593652 RepID=A0A7S8C9L2_9BACI|nr:DUF3221 domain-containing protein [Mangrovibacillus cuniculi]QPC45932.1 DUF3221 domain-containing protein [Mangrovibacillus cuniculi]